MKDLVSITKDENAMLEMGFKMISDDEPQEKNDDRYQSDSISDYTKRASKLEEKKYNGH